MHFAICHLVSSRLDSDKIYQPPLCLIFAQKVPSVTLPPHPPRRQSDCSTKIHVRSIDVLCAGRVNEIHIPKTCHLSPPTPPPPSYNYICGEERSETHRPMRPKPLIPTLIDMMILFVLLLLFCFNLTFPGGQQSDDERRKI